MSRSQTLAAVDFDDLRRQVAGSVVLEGDTEYDELRRVWNGMIDRRPAVIVRAASVADIAPSILFARRNELRIAVRGGGHSVAGKGTVNRGLVLDLGALTAVEVDVATSQVRVEPGAVLADLDRATEPHGLVVPVGVISQTGVAGLTLGGGVGWLTRAYGLTVDSLIAADVVTASGELVHASATENPELFWGLRGGGGNFGVVSSFTFQGHPFPAEVFSGNFIYRQAAWPAALAAYEVWSRDLPDELTSIISVMVPPPDWDLGDEPVLIIGFAWASPDHQAGADLVDRLRSAAPPDEEVVEPARWSDWQSAADALFPKGVRGYWKNTSFDRLDDAVIEVLTRRGAEQTWRGTAFDIHHFGGAFGRVPEDATPFPSRQARFWLNIYGFWADPADDERRSAFVRDFADDMAPLASGAQYVNFLGEDRGGDRVGKALAVYGQRKLDRLMALKRGYDPENIFRRNHNIPPG